VQEALRAADIDYDKVIAGHGSPIPFLRRARVTSCARRPERRSYGVEAGRRDGHHPLQADPFLDRPAEVIPQGSHALLTAPTSLAPTYRGRSATDDVGLLSKLTRILYPFCTHLS
jgi:hypothetical protein